MGKRLRTPCQNITIRNCLMEFGHGAVTLGSEMSAGIKDIAVTQCLFRKTDRGLRIKTQRGRGNTAVIDGIVFDNVRMENVLTPFVINMFYKARNDYPDEAYKYNLNPQPVDESTPYFGSFTFRNIEAVDIEWAAGIFWGLPEQPIGSVHIENVTFSVKENAQPGIPAMTLNAPKMCKEGLCFSNVTEAVIENVQFHGFATETCRFLNVELPV